MAKAWRMSSCLALALLVALMAAAMERSVAEEAAASTERSLAEEEASAPEADSPAAVLEVEVNSWEEAHAPGAAAADEDAADGDGAPAPAPASEEEDEDEDEPKTLGAKAKAGLHHMMEGLSAGKAKLECKVLRSCPASDAPPTAS